MEIKRETLDDVLMELLGHLLDQRQSFQTTRGETREEMGVLIEIANPRARLSRTESRGKLFSAIGELLWYLSGDNSLEFIEFYLKKYREESADGRTVYGGYGPRLFNNRGINQIYQVIKLLQANPLSRRAVIQIFDAGDNRYAESMCWRYKEVPCTIALQFFIRDSRLNIIVNMRSNDAYIGLPHDMFCFSMLQELVARSVGVELGAYKHFVGSMHLYAHNFEGAERFIKEAYQQRVEMPAMPAGDPWSSVQKMLAIEPDLRAATMPSSIEDLPSYWQDIAWLLLVFAAKTPSDLDLAAQQVTSKCYKPYIQSRRITLVQTASSLNTGV